MIVPGLFDDLEISVQGPSEDAALAECNEWYTRTIYIEAARRVFGGTIHLDPASCEFANRRVRALRYYTEQEDGLSRPWRFGDTPANVWINPPYKARKDLGQKESAYVVWVPKLVAEYDAGNVAQAILFIPLHPEREWWAPLYRFPLCICNHQPFFDRPNGKKSEKLRHALCFVYLGPNTEAFFNVFCDFGNIAPSFIPARPRKKSKQVQQLALEVAP